MSGEAFKMNHDLPSLETATEAWVRGFVAGSPPRARRQAGAFEFHCGKPPPAAEPRTTTRMADCPETAPAGARVYLMTAQAYELISRPTAISTIRGFVHMVISHDHHNRVL
jgi:hypothetical protein